jgi:hypothetical protein
VIIEMRTYDLQPGTMRTVMERFAAGLPHRTKFSPLGAFWRTEVGPLNRVVHVWPYEDLLQRERLRKEASDGVNWPPKVSEFCVSQESKILLPAPFSPPLKPAKLGELYEMRTYTVKPGLMSNMIEAWGKQVDDRLKFSPLAACWYSELGPLNQFIHIWPYADMNERNRLRAAATASGKWPPPTAPFLSKQETAFLIPTAFSPLH